MKRLPTICQRPAHTQGCGSQPLLVILGMVHTHTNIRSNTQQGHQRWSNLTQRCQGFIQQLLGLKSVNFKSINDGFDYQLDTSAMLGAVEPEHPRWSGWCRFSLTPM